MLTDLCKELNNWFNYNQPKYIGTFTILNGVIFGSQKLQKNQYFRIVGSIFNDGVYQYNEDSLSNLTDESFYGGIWAMAIPKEVIALSAEIDEWIAKYQTVDSQAMSPYTSESFGGYSYSKLAGRSSYGDGSADGSTWQGMFASRLNKWRKIRP